MACDTGASLLPVGRAGAATARRSASQASAPPVAQTLPDGGTLTVLFTDAEGSTPLWERHEETMRAVAARHDALLGSLVNKSLVQATGREGGEVRHTLLETVRR